MSEDIIRAEGLTRVFNSHLTAVDHVDFSVKHGEIFWVRARVLSWRFLNK
jgi:ABC-type multidrug transport system ATPase subunit